MTVLGDLTGQKARSCRPYLAGAERLDDGDHQGYAPSVRRREMWRCAALCVPLALFMDAGYVVADPPAGPRIIQCYPDVQRTVPPHADPPSSGLPTD